MIEIIASVKKKDIPKNSIEMSEDVKKVLKSVAALRSEEALHIVVDKKSIINNIANALKTNFKHSKYRVSQRAGKDGKTNVYISRKNQRVHF